VTVTVVVVIHELIATRVAAAEPTVLACSALERRYRARLAALETPSPDEAIVVDANGPVADVVEEVVERLEQGPGATMATT